jgi:hypothetical protein
MWDRVVRPRQRNARTATAVVRRNRTRRQTEPARQLSRCDPQRVAEVSRHLLLVGKLKLQGERRQITRITSVDRNSRHRDCRWLARIGCPSFRPRGVRTRKPVARHRCPRLRRRRAREQRRYDESQGDGAVHHGVHFGTLLRRNAVPREPRLAHDVLVTIAADPGYRGAHSAPRRNRRGSAARAPHRGRRCPARPRR